MTAESHDNPSNAGYSSFITAGANYPGWLTAVIRLVYRTCFLWEELFYGISKGGGSAKQEKMTLEENIRCYNPMAVGGDLRATVDRQLQADSKCSNMSGLQYKSFHEYLDGDTKGALERFHFCLSDVLTPKNTPQENRLSEQTHSTGQLIAMLECHVEHMFPATVMEAYKEGLKKDAEEDEQPEAEANAGDDLVPASEPGAARRARPRARQDEGQPAAKKPKKNEVAPKKKHVLMPPSGLLTTLDKDSQDFFTRACNYYRQALPDEYANHAFFASAMKVDQTLARFAATRARRREAFLKTIFADEWVMVDETHPVDMPMAEAFLRCDLAMRFAVYNELQHKKASTQVAAGSGKKANTEHAESDPQIAAAPNAQLGKISDFEKSLRKVLKKAEENEPHQVDYHPDTFRWSPEYKKMEGWCKFIAAAHSHQLIDKIQSTVNDVMVMTSATEAILNGEVGVVGVGHGRTTGPSFILDTVKVAAWLVDEGATQHGDVGVAVADRNVDGA